MKVACTIIHYMLFWKCPWVQWSSIGSINSDSLCDWMVGNGFFITILQYLFCSPLANTSKAFFIYWQIAYISFVFHCLHCICIIAFIFHCLLVFLCFFSIWLKLILSWWFSDCIGSAFNVKGAMQCPNCRKIEKGQWLYANGCRSLPEFTMDDWAHDEDLYDLSYSEMVNDFFPL